MHDQPAPAAMNNYLIFHHSGGHPIIDLIQAASTLQAILWSVSDGEIDSFLNEDGSYTEMFYHGADSKSQKGITYPHILAYIEAHHKTYGEWQIRMLPPGVLNRRQYTAFCGESDSGEQFASVCRPLLRQQFPRSRAKSFTWHLENHRTLVTFYRKKRPSGIEILLRCQVSWFADERITIWKGTYDDILNQLSLKGDWYEESHKETGSE